MSYEDRIFEGQDREVIAMVNKGRGPGGKLPAIRVSVLPADRADRCLKLDARIQKMKAAAPAVAAGAMCLGAATAALQGLMHPAVSLIIILCLMGNYALKRMNKED